MNQLLVHCDKFHDEKVCCDWKGGLDKLEKHQQNDCQYLAVPCSLLCGKQFERRLLKEHEEHFCSKRSMEMQVRSLTGRLQVITAKNDKQAQKIQEQSQIIEQQAEQIKQMSVFKPDKCCPVCNTKFPSRMKQRDFELHVQGHFQL